MIQKAVDALPKDSKGNWAMVGEAAHLAERLTELADRLLGTGEYADEVENGG